MSLPISRRRLVAAPLAALAFSPLAARFTAPAAAEGETASFAQPPMALVPGAPEWAANAALAYPAPGRWQVGDKELVVSLSQQRLWAYLGEQPVLSTLVSTGTAETWETETPVGQWRILVKYEIQDMEGTVSGEAYRVEDVPHVMYFTNQGHALHGTYWHNNFGTPMSHGCVNLPLDVADWMYGWALEWTAVTVIP